MSGTQASILASDEDWAALLGDDDGLQIGDLEESDFEGDDLTTDLLAPSEELGRVSRRIAAQYAEVLASFAALAFRGEASRGAVEQVESAIDALCRLAEASHDPLQVSLLLEVRDWIRPATTGKPNSRARQSALVSLRDWIPRFAQTLEAEDASRLARLVSWDDGSAPLMDELAELHGIGPKRLQRLYASGLYTVDVVATADPQDIAAVTGLPLALAESVVTATRTFALEERRRCIESLRDRAVRLRHLLKTVPAGNDDNDLAELAQEAIWEVESTFRHLRDLGVSR